MKKILIITGIVLTTAVTAFSLTRQETKAGQIKVKIENTAAKTSTDGGADMVLATAD